MATLVFDGSVWRSSGSTATTGSDITYVDNGDGTLNVTGGTTNPDNTVELSGSGYSNNGNGTLTLN